jgi:hypothetical protein
MANVSHNVCYLICVENITGAFWSMVPVGSSFTQAVTLTVA